MTLIDGREAVSETITVGLPVTVSDSESEGLDPDVHSYLVAISDMVLAYEQESPEDYRSFIETLTSMLKEAGYYIEPGRHHHHHE